MSNNPLFSERKVGDKFLRNDTLKTYLSAPTLQKSAAMHKEANPFFALSTPLIAAGMGLGAYGLYKDVPNLYRSVKKGKKWDAAKDAGLVALDTAGLVPGVSMFTASLRGGAAAAKALNAVKGVKTLGQSVNIGHKAKTTEQAAFEAAQGKWLGDASKAKPGWWNFFTKNRMAQRAGEASEATVKAAANFGTREAVNPSVWGGIQEGAKMPFQAIQSGFRGLQYAPMHYMKNVAPGLQAKYIKMVEDMSKTKPWLALELANRPEVFLPIVAGTVVGDPLLRKNRTTGWDYSKNNQYAVSPEENWTSNVNNLQNARRAYNTAAPIVGSSQL